MRAFAVAVLVSLLVACGAAAGPAAGVVARVNDQNITAAELDALVATQTNGASAPLSPEQNASIRLALLNQLIDRRALLQYAAQAGITADPKEVARDLELERARQPTASEADLKQQVNDNLVLNQLLEREVGAKVKVSDDEIAAFYQKNQASFNLPERQFHVLEIVVTPTGGPVANLAEDKAATPAAAKKKILMLQQRLAQHADFGELAQQYSEDASTAASGGDLGLVPQSVLLAQTPPLLRDAILGLHPGQVSGVIQASGSYYLLKLVGVDPAGLRPLSDPQVKQSIHDMIAGGRRQVIQTAFLTTVRDQAKVVNYLAEDLFKNGPSLAP